jgi:hypothetical protein
MSVSLPSLPKLDPLSRIRVSRKVRISGQRVTFEKTSTWWLATGWEEGIPVARKPISESQLLDVVSRFPDHMVTYLSQEDGKS